MSLVPHIIPIINIVIKHWLNPQLKWVFGSVIELSFTFNLNCFAISQIERFQIQCVKNVWNISNILLENVNSKLSSFVLNHFSIQWHTVRSSGDICVTAQMRKDDICVTLKSYSLAWFLKSDRCVTLLEYEFYLSL